MKSAQPAFSNSRMLSTIIYLQQNTGTKHLTEMVLHDFSRVNPRFSRRNSEYVFCQRPEAAILLLMHWSDCYQQPQLEKQMRY